MCKLKEKLEGILSRHDKENTKDLDSVYHYTSIKGLMGILGSQSIHLNCVNNLLDDQEVNLGQELFEELVNNENSVSIKNVQNLKNYMKNGTLHFTASFSGLNSNTKLWNYYSDHFNGAVIEFKTDKKNKFEDEDTKSRTQFYFQKVIYNKEKARSIFREMININEQCTCPGGLQEEFHLCMVASVLFPAVKRRDYEFEQEYRLINITQRKPAMHDYVISLDRAVPELGRLKYSFEFSAIKKIYLCKNVEDSNLKLKKLIQGLNSKTHFREFKKIELLELNTEEFSHLNPPIVYKKI